MDKTVKAHGGGTEGEEYVACSAKVMTPETKWNRHVDSNKLFTDIQAAVNSLA